MRTLISLLLGVMLTCSSTSQAAEPLVFVSAFKADAKAGIHAFKFDVQTGALTPLHQTSDVKNPFFIAISPDHRFLYSVDTKVFGGPFDEYVTAYAIEGRSGELKRLNQQPSRCKVSCYLDVDATGKTLLVAGYTSGTVASLPIHEDGTLGEVVSVMQHTGSSINPGNQQGPHAHSFVISPDNHFAFAADLGIDKVLIYHLDPATARLTPNDSQPFAKLTPGSGPRHQAFHPNGKRLYVITEIKNTVAFFDYTPETGALTERQTISTLPADFKGKSYCADLKITPDGHFLYGTNRGHDSIAIFRIADDGMLQWIAAQPSRGQGPQNLLITPDGHWLLCANMPGNNATVFKIDPQSGHLEPAGDPIAVPMPSCIRWLP